VVDGVGMDGFQDGQFIDDLGCVGK
jgi:hypothetical protein